MLPETVAVPFKYEVLAPDRTLIVSYDLELVAGIVGVQQDTVSMALTPRLGWFVRTVKSAEVLAEKEKKPEGLL